MVIRKPITHQVATELLKNPQSRIVILDDQTKDIQYDDIVVEYKRDINTIVLYSTAVHLKEKK